MKPPVADFAPDPYNSNCPTRLLLDRIGDKWTVLVLGLLRDGPVRFNALRRSIAGVTQKMLSQTLKGLERDGLVSREIIPGAPIGVEYALTPLGETLISTIDALQHWARAHIGDVATARARYDDEHGRPRGRRAA